MKISNICAELLKAYSKKSKSKYVLGYFEGGFGKKDVFITLDGYHGWLVPDEEFPFDMDKILNGRTLIDADKLFKSNYEEVDGFLTKEMKLKGDNKTTLVKFTDKDKNMEVWVDQKFLKYFDIEYSTFKISSPVSPVFVYENDIVVGLMLPTRMNKND